MKAYRLIAAAVFLLSLVRPAWGLEKPCEYCHSGHRGVMVLLNTNVNELCSGCHADRLQAGEHKVGMSPPMVVRDLPLQGGKMTCITCHDPHGKTADMLRMQPWYLCASCHAK